MDGAIFDDADISGANFLNADISYAKFWDVIGKDKSNLNLANNNELPVWLFPKTRKFVIQIHLFKPTAYGNNFNSLFL